MSHAHAAAHDHDDHSSPEYIERQKKIFLFVLAALGIGTVLTVWVAYIDMPVWAHIFVALFIATIKASLVLLFFMHFISEKATVYLFMGFTAFFVTGLFLLSIWAWSNPIMPEIFSARPVPMEDRVP